MKNICFKMTCKALLTLTMLLAVAMPSFAQKITVHGTVYEPEGEPAIGASIEVKGVKGVGVTTDFDGKFTVKVAPNATLVVSYVGCNTQEVPVQGRQNIEIKLKTNTVAMSELVVVGYGTVKKSDATGSLGVVKPSEIEAGLASSAQDLLVGASPGVVVSTDGGSPNGSAKIQVRGGASLSATTEPLIVIDGVPMDAKGVAGSSNPLSLVNPENIENISILKSASATAIYGSRASNGVIIITTKSGKSGKPQVNFAANFFVNTPRNYMDMMDAKTFTNFIHENYGAESAQAKCLGTANTNWQKEVLRTSFSQDYSLSVGGTAGFLPYRVAVGYTDNQGILRTSGMQRVTGSLNLTPKFFDNLLSVNLNVKGAYVTNRYDQGALGGAIGFNPTLPVKNPEGNVFNGWTTYIGGGAVAGPNTPGTDINTLQAVNPRSLVDDYNKRSHVYQSVGNIQFDLKMPFLTDLRANLNLGYDYSKGDENSLNAPGSPRAWLDGFTVKGEDGQPINIKRGYATKGFNYGKNLSLLLDFYLNYNKSVEAIASDFDVTAGYSWQHFDNDGHGYGIVDPNIANIVIPNVEGATAEQINANAALQEQLRGYAGYQYAPTNYWAKRYQLVSFFGRANYTLKNRYMATVTVRRDGTSRFGTTHRWGTFPAAALGWKINEEAFMENTRSWLNDLKLRFDYGVTGQQGLDDDYYPYLPVYTNNTNLSQRYPIGEGGAPIHLFQPNKYNADLKWESTTTYNVGLDFGFLNNRINGSVEYYVRNTTDLLVFADYAAGSNLSNQGMINAGDLKNTGVEFNINTKPVVTKDFTWSSNVNVAWNKNKITRIANGYSGLTGGIGNGLTVQRHKVGYPAYSFYVYEQVYDKDGNPLEGVYVDQNGDGNITEADKIMYHSINPAVTATWTNNFNIGNWDFGFVLRGNFDNWIYNQSLSSNCFISATAVAPVSNLLANTYIFKQERSSELRLSNYFVQNGSFVRCDNITLGYTWPKLAYGMRVRAYGAVQNPFVITKYKGLDPEVIFNGGIDNNPYPRPITASAGVVVTF